MGGGVGVGVREKKEGRRMGDQMDGWMGGRME